MKNAHIWRLNNTLLNNQKKITEEINKKKRNPNMHRKK